MIAGHSVAAAERAPHVLAELLAALPPGQLEAVHGARDFARWRREHGPGDP